MPYINNLDKASTLKKELDQFRPLTPEMERRIMQKFRLDWNYHSSHIEGNQLTYGETKALILFGQTAQAKPLKDHLEMTGHDEAVKYIEEIISQERTLSESFIRELHVLLLKKPYEVDAITPDGKPTKRTISIGKYKTVPNHVKTQTDEIFYFATPEETPAKMDDLMQWYHENLHNEALHPVLFATEFHYRFIRIHPFDDGNGRIARMLMNFILMQKGYPPAIIKTEDKNDYYTALQQADSGQLDYFFNYVCEQVNSSLSIMIKGAKGESIEEEDDLEKEIALWKNKLNDKRVEVMPLSDEIVYNHYFNWIKSFLTLYREKSKQFEEMFTSTLRNGMVNNRYSGKKNDELDFIEDNVIKNWNAFTTQNKNSEMQTITYDPMREIILNIQFNGFNKDNINTFNQYNSLKIRFEEFRYIIQFDNDIIKENIYSDFLSKDISNEIVKTCISKTFEQIKAKIKTE